MNIERIHCIYFSPTTTSKQIVQAIGDGCEDGCQVIDTDLTYPDFLISSKPGPADLAVIGVPVYAGRVPTLAVERLRQVQGSSTPAIVVVVYGNRAYEDALIELRDIAEEIGFQVIGGAAFIGEHSFSTAERPIGAGRPDPLDLAAANKFGKMVITKMGTGNNGPDRVVAVPGGVPYQEGMKNLPFTPVIDQASCSLCEVCIDHCPSGAITLESTIIMDADICILCAACLKNCPESAISLGSTPIAERMKMLHENCSERKEPEFFF